MSQLYNKIAEKEWSKLAPEIDNKIFDLSDRYNNKQLEIFQGDNKVYEAFQADGYGLFFYSVDETNGTLSIDKNSILKSIDEETESETGGKRKRTTRRRKGRKSTRKSRRRSRR